VFRIHRSPCGICRNPKAKAFLALLAISLVLFWVSSMIGQRMIIQKMIAQKNSDSQA
jgi:hypothetical protein